MRHSFVQFFKKVLLASCLLLAGCNNAKDEAKLLFTHAGYERWLCTQRSFLSNLPPAIVYYKGTSLEYDFKRSADGRPPQPVIEYYIKAGDWDGLIDLKFHLNVDAQNRPTLIREESAQFYRLPASETVIETGQKMHRYYGLTVPPGQVAGVISRAVRRDHFDDLRSQVQGNTFYQHEEGDDPWLKLRKK